MGRADDTVSPYSFTPGKTNVTLSMGMSVMGNPGGGAYVGSYVSPFVSYNISKRFRLKVGAGIYNNYAGYFYDRFDPYGSFGHRPATFSRVMVGGDYLVNEKVTLSGLVYKDFNPFAGNHRETDLRLDEAEGVMFNINYRPSENFEINIGVDYSRGYNPYRHSPFHRQSPFSPYPGMYGW